MSLLCLYAIYAGSYFSLGAVHYIWDNIRKEYFGFINICPVTAARAASIKAFKEYYGAASRDYNK